jgi:VanZ family protein
MIGLLSLLLCQSTFAQFSNQTYPESVNRKAIKRIAVTEATAYVSGLSFLYFIWYKDTERVPFHFYDDSKGYLQIDKFGHAYTAYQQSYASYYALRKAGVSKRKALLYGGTLGIIFQTPIEIFDGLYEGWGFSWSDMLANTLGSALVISQEALFDEQVVLMKFSYASSPYAAYYPPLGETPLEQFFYDYNGHTYWLSGNLKKMSGLAIFPDWLNIAIGYSGNGMLKEFENPTTYQGNPLPVTNRHRQFLLSLDVDFTRIPVQKRWLKALFRAANMVKVPFPALEYNKIEGFKMRPFYF